jgi:hypothetical protein
MWLYLLLAVGLSEPPHQSVHAQEHRSMLEDLSCNAVNDAYLATFSARRVTVKTYGLMADGSMKLHDEARYSEFGLYEKLSVSNRWLRRYLGTLRTFDDHGPIFTSCKLLPTAASEGTSGLHYSATWNSFPFSAAYEVWVSPYSGRSVKTVRDHSLTSWQFPFAKVVEVFGYDPQDALPSTGN